MFCTIWGRHREVLVAANENGKCFLLRDFFEATHGGKRMSSSCAAAQKTTLIKKQVK